MSQSELMRTYMEKVRLMEDDFVVTCMGVAAQHPLNGVLLESTSGMLLEGPLADRIKQTTAAITKKYNNVTNDLLLKAVVKAQTLFSGDPKVTGLLSKVSKVAKFAVKNRALISILVGIVGTLIGMANNPAAAAQASSQLDHVLSGNDIDSIIDQLEASGIDVGAAPDLGGLEGIPPDVATVVTKAAKALRAIDDFEFTYGSQMSADSNFHMEHATVDGEIVKSSHITESNIKVTTPDGKLVLGEMHSKLIQDQDGVKFEETVGGVKFDLLKAFNSLNADQREQVQDYLDQSLSRRDFIGSKKPMSEAEGQGPASAILQDKAEDFAALFATKLKDQPDGKYRVRLGPKGLQTKKIS